MNKDQRKQLNDVVTALSDLRDQLDAIASDERDKYDNLTEGLQATERGQALSDAADTLEGVVSTLDDAISELDSLT